MMRGSQRSPAECTSKCRGKLTLTTKIGEPMKSFVEDEAEEAGVTRAEFVRLLLDAYKESQEGNLPCGACGASLNLAGAIHE